MGRRVTVLHLEAELELVVLRGLGLLSGLQLQRGQKHVLKSETSW